MLSLYVPGTHTSQGLPRTPFLEPCRLLTDARLPRCPCPVCSQPATWAVLFTREPEHITPPLGAFHTFLSGVDTPALQEPPPAPVPPCPVAFCPGTTPFYLLLLSLRSRLLVSNLLRTASSSLLFRGPLDLWDRLLVPSRPSRTWHVFADACLSSVTATSDSWSARLEGHTLVLVRPLSLWPLVMAAARNWGWQ